MADEPPFGDGDPGIPRGSALGRNRFRLPTGDASKFAVFISLDADEGAVVEMNACKLHSAEAVDMLIDLLNTLKKSLPRGHASGRGDG